MTQIATLKTLFDKQKSAFEKNPAPSLKERADRLDAVAGALIMNREKIHEALREDFSAHPTAQADFIEIFGVAGRMAYAKSMLETWTAVSERDVDPAMFGESKAYVAAQPKGIIGNIVPWNFPFDIGIGPLAEMLAGGNSVIIKPSDMTPACSALMKDMLASAISEEIVAVAPGDLELAKFFPSLPWDHLMYTGNPEVARFVAKAAAENLTPLTLELGGKCPAVLTTDSVTRDTVSSILRTKMVKNGQMCVAPDYALVPRALVGEFVSHAQAYVGEHAPDYTMGDHITGIINDRHCARIEGLISLLETSGTEIVTLGESGDTNGRRLPIRLVIDPPAESAVMRDEIFGPILPVVPYDSLDDAITFIARRERPLGVYAFTDDPMLKDRILTQTHSGGVSFNSCASQASLPNMGFGGSGMSGYGRHHGIEGFREFTNPRGVVDFDARALAINVTPPYGEISQGLIQHALSELNQA